MVTYSRREVDGIKRVTLEHRYKDVYTVTVEFEGPANTLELQNASGAEHELIYGRAHSAVIKAN